MNKNINITPLAIDNFECAEHSFVGPTHVIGVKNENDNKEYVLISVFHGMTKDGKLALFVKDDDLKYVIFDKTYIFINDPFLDINILDDLVRDLFNKNIIKHVDRNERGTVDHPRIFLTKQNCKTLYN